MANIPADHEAALARGSWLAKTRERVKNTKPVAEKSKPAKPPWLSAAAKPHWARLLKQCEGAGVPLNGADSSTLGLACEALATYERLRDEADGAPSLHITPSGERPHPLHRMRDDALRDVHRLLRDLGLSPTSRKGVNLKPESTTPRGFADPTEFFAKG